MLVFVFGSPKLTPRCPASQYGHGAAACFRFFRPDSCTTCRRTVSVRPTRSTSSQRRPSASPRRRPVYAITSNRPPSRLLPIASRKAPSSSPVHGSTSVSAACGSVAFLATLNAIRSFLAAVCNALDSVA
ncbi:hypothetical protein FM21_05855 [Streptomyces mutabilis]|uniref:Uncharacterized protein n=1 Tax=Streptomyces mutabilis TaxID=67332 RepID=A0A086N3D2_9ACTN|nr:hypothetical protein FM21_05855 [Streptomyces mutabilis]